MTMDKVSIDLWVLLIGVALPSTCLLMVSLIYCWRRLFRRGAKAVGETPGFDQQVLLEMVLQQTDNALNNIVDAVQAQRAEMLKVLETRQLSIPGNNSPSGAAPLSPVPSEGQIITATDAGFQKKITATEGQANPEGSGAATDNCQSGSMAAGIDGQKTSSDAMFDPYRQIPDHIQSGLSISDVATRLDLPESAVELYVNLRMPEMKDGQKSA